MSKFKREEVYLSDMILLYILNVSFVSVFAKFNITDHQNFVLFVLGEHYSSNNFTEPILQVPITT